MERSYHWENEAFLNEIKERIINYESGEVQCHSWEEVKARVRSGDSSSRQDI